MTTTSLSLYAEYEKSQLMTTNPMSFEEWKKARKGRLSKFNMQQLVALPFDLGIL